MHSLKKTSRSGAYRHKYLKAYFLYAAGFPLLTVATAHAALGAPGQKPGDPGQEQAAAGQQPTEKAAAPDTADIVVTGSRITISGYRQPTPVTVVSAEKLQRDGQTDLSSVILQLPSAGASSSPNTSNGSQSVSAGTAGLALVDLRGLGPSRTLVLFDGQRIVPSTQSGGVDLNLIPSSLVQRIDVVTGGASAAWGSDAVSGVVNIVLNKKFTGLAVNLEGATNAGGYRNTGKGELSFGTDLFDGKAHLILSGAYLYSPDVVIPQQTSWYKSQALVNNPAYTATNGQPRLIHAENVGLANATQGGLIVTGPLAGIQFVGNGTPAPFDFGHVSGGALSVGGTFANPVYNGQADDLAVPIKSTTLFGYFGYDFSDHVHASLELNYGHSDTVNGSGSWNRVGSSSVTIRRDNPYLDPGLAAQMAAMNISSFTLGTTNSNNLDPLRGDNYTEDSGLGNLHDDVTRTLFRQVATLSGSFGGWSWNAYVQHSEIDRHTHLPVDPVIANYNLAVDAIRVTTANVGSSGLPLGSIACRSTLTNPGNGCVPLNVMGINVASKDAIAYVNSGPAESDLTLAQYTGGLSVQGQPFSTWAGPVAVSTGAEYRRESVLQTADALSYARAYAAGNFQYMNASYYTYEGFAEANIPLLKDSFVDSLDASIAGRATHYSTSGWVGTWKFGLTSQINSDLRIRGTISADIRAPSLSDLYNPGSTSQQVVSDPFRPGTPAGNIFALSSGNPDLKPERARTYTVGTIVTPHWIPGLSASLDYYSINIKGAISSASFNQVLAQCFAGNQIFCPLIQRDASGAITIIGTYPVNADSYKTSGLDFQADYGHAIGRGRLTLSLMGNYTFDETVNSLGVLTHVAGSIGRDSPYTTMGVPKLRATLSATYSDDRYSVTAQTRFIGSAVINNAWGPLDIDDNHVPAIAYLDLRASYYLGDHKHLQFYVAADNVLGTNPPIIPSSIATASPSFYVPARTDIYDALGTTFRFGIRVKL